jgi:hypothetical protein
MGSKTCTCCKKTKNYSGGEINLMQSLEYAGQPPGESLPSLPEPATTGNDNEINDEPKGKTSKEILKLIPPRVFMEDTQ